MEESPLSRAPSRGGVNFLNVARTYIPNTKVECHYTLPPGTMPSASDWIGIFKVEAACVRDYHTFVWSSVPESTTDGSPIHTSVQFQASYLPKPGAQLYQFRYVNRQGRVCGQSPPFQFREPRPMDELVTLEEADGGSDILLVVPKATVLQNQLDESQQERNDLMQLKLQLEGQVTELRSRVQELERALATARQEHAELMEQYKGISRSHGEITEERDILSRQQGDHVARILELEDDIQTISEKVLTKEVELDRLRDTVKALTREQEKLLGQLKEVQADKEQSEAELQVAQQENRRLNLDLQEAKSWQEEQSTQAQRLKDKVAQMKDTLGQAQQRVAEKDKILKLSAEILRLEKAVQEERTQNQVFKTELAREKDSSLVQLSESKRELTELRSALRVLQKEKEQLQEEKQELLEYMRKLEARLEKVADEKWNEDAATEDEEATAGLSCPAALTDSEDESPEDMRLPPYGLCEHRDPGSSPAGPREASPLVVISQPAPISPHLSGPAEDSSSDSEAEDEKSVLMAAVQSGGEEANLLLPELGSAFYDMASTIFCRAQIALLPLSPASTPSPTTSGFTVGPLSETSTGGPATPTWKECPICKERFPAESDKDALEDHMDGHFFFSTQDPFTFE
ncbi:calcium-binding and coiled-coil domain-containing protein 1 isoform X3 [Trachypithecus francoisi]|uniref:calcium-binding and coiled-coil domain-containing protein 1 isoform X3 n=1 Tax=Trachypithecus francoisi TaxID=54180 RepID=UPI00141B6CB8|nr:calcium-binding and coiled-coil domain-containing protein 1 isoform X3 [Trachypithecus francoisi]